MARAWATWAAMTPKQQNAEKLRSRAMEAAAFALCPVMEREGLDIIAPGEFARVAVEAFERVMAGGPIHVGRPVVPCTDCGAPATRTTTDGVPLCEADFAHLCEHGDLGEGSEGG